MIKNFISLILEILNHESYETADSLTYALLKVKINFYRKDKNYKKNIDSHEYDIDETNRGERYKINYQLYPEVLRERYN